MNKLTEETISLFLGDEASDVCLTQAELASIGKIKSEDLKSVQGSVPSLIIKTEISFGKVFKAAILARITSLGLGPAYIKEIETKLMILFKTAKAALAIEGKPTMYRWSICEGKNYDVILSLCENGDLEIRLFSIPAGNSIKQASDHVMVNATAILRNMYSYCLPQGEK